MTKYNKVVLKKDIPFAKAGTTFYVYDDDDNRQYIIYYNKKFYLDDLKKEPDFFKYLE
ncbi:MAG: hypothetical protein ACFFDN_44560 [Candidatus Hodarchaeota archaeon]